MAKIKEGSQILDKLSIDSELIKDQLKQNTNIGCY